MKTFVIKNEKIAFRNRYPITSQISQAENWIIINIAKINVMLDWLLKQVQNLEIQVLREVEHEQSRYLSEVKRFTL